jgi:8-oxo-dGTP diphosphatase
LTDRAAAAIVARMSSAPRSVDDVDWGAWKPSERAVLCFVLDPDRILLIHKKTGLGRGKVNGPGGRIEPGESPAEAAVRETVEETGIVPGSLREAAELSFVFTDGYSLHCTAFVASKWSGEPVRTREADPFWCPLDAIPYDRMWADDVLWLPRALAGERIAGRFVFDDDAMLSHRLSPSTGPA